MTLLSEVVAESALHEVSPLSYLLPLSLDFSLLSVVLTFRPLRLTETT